MELYEHGASQARRVMCHGAGLIPSHENKAGELSSRCYRGQSSDLECMAIGRACRVHSSYFLDRTRSCFALTGPLSRGQVRSGEPPGCALTQRSDPLQSKILVLRVDGKEE